MDAKWREKEEEQEKESTRKMKSWIQIKLTCDWSVSQSCFWFVVSVVQPVGEPRTTRWIRRRILVIVNEQQSSTHGSINDRNRTHEQGKWENERNAKNEESRNEIWVNSQKNDHGKEERERKYK